MLNTRQDLAFGGPKGSKFVRHNDPRRVARNLQQLAKETFRCLFVAVALHQNIEHVSVLINGSPEVVQFASDADEHLI
jgi:hypothetical protein